MVSRLKGEAEQNKINMWQIIFADKSGHRTKSRLVNLGVQFAQDLGLHSSRRLRQLCTEADEALLKNAFWHLYAIEKADAVDRGRPSVRDLPHLKREKIIQYSTL